MNNLEVSKAVYEVSSRVFEDMAFVFTELDEKPAPWEEDLVAAELTFTGEHKGKLMLITYSELCLELAANLLGIELDDPEADEKSLDALGELLNVIGGILMEKIFGKNQNHQLGVPSMKKITQKELLEQGDNCTCVSLLDEEDRRIDVVFQREG